MTASVSSTVSGRVVRKDVKDAVDADAGRRGDLEVEVGRAQSHGLREDGIEIERHRGLIGNPQLLLTLGRA